MTLPVPIERVPPSYPASELAARHEASVWLTLTVAVDGSVAAVAVDDSAGPAFDAAALEAAKRWRFTPALRGGVPFEAQIHVPFRFRLPEPEPVPASQPGPAPDIYDEPADSNAGPSRSATPAATPATPETSGAGPADQPLDVTVHGMAPPEKTNSSVYQADVGAQAYVPRAPNANELMKALAPGVLLTNAGGEGHADQIFLRGFDAREGQDIEFSVNGVPFNEVGNPHGNGYADSHFIIPELVTAMRIVEGPFDPRQGNFAVAGSAEFELGLEQRGFTLKLGGGSFGTVRSVLLWGPKEGSKGTFAGLELYSTKGFGQNRDGRRGTLMVQYEGDSGDIQYRIGFNAYLASFHTAGVLRDDDFEKGRFGFYDSADPAQGEDASRYALTGTIDAPAGDIRLRNQVFLVARPLRVRENFTGFLLDPQEPQQQPHPQRGDLIDLEATEWTVGARGSGKLVGELFDARQELEVGYFARGDFVNSSQRRVEAATLHPYHLESDLSSRLGDIGLYLAASFRPWTYLALRGGLRADVLTYDVENKCAVASVAHPSATDPPGDASCLSQQDFGRYREPTQRASTTGLALLPRASLELGPFAGLSASVGYGRGVRSIDPNYVIQDAKAPFARADSVEAGLSYSERFDDVELSASSSLFWTFVDRDLIFSETAGRNILGGGTTRLGDASQVRVRGGFFDVSANVTYVRATFSDTGLLIPYIPDLVVRFDGTLLGDIPVEELEIMGQRLRGSFGMGATYVAPRALPQGERSDSIATLDLGATLGMWLFDVGVSVTNVVGTQYRLGEYNYVSDFHTEPNPDAPRPTLVSVRHFAAGAPRAVMVNLTAHVGGEP